MYVVTYRDDRTGAERETECKDPFRLQRDHGLTAEQMDIVHAGEKLYLSPYSLSPDTVIIEQKYISPSIPAKIRVNNRRLAEAKEQYRNSSWRNGPKWRARIHEIEKYAEHLQRMLEEEERMSRFMAKHGTD